MRIGIKTFRLVGNLGMAGPGAASSGRVFSGFYHEWPGRFDMGCSPDKCTLTNNNCHTCFQMYLRFLQDRELLLTGKVSLGGSR
ncbi:MAG TPA: hypothetical protein DCS05_02475 [Nitrospiraceae bacterium]|nr:hypothetical protein [Nitrospiraceae bacterium]